MHELSKDTHTLEIKLVVPKPHERPYCLPHPCSESVSMRHRGCQARCSDEAEKCGGIGAPLISHELSRARRLIMDQWRVCTSKGEPRKSLLKNYRQALWTTPLGFHHGGGGERTHKKGLLPYFSFPFSRDSVSYTIRPQCFLRLPSQQRD